MALVFGSAEAQQVLAENKLMSGYSEQLGISNLSKKDVQALVKKNEAVNEATDAIDEAEANLETAEREFRKMVESLAERAGLDASEMRAKIEEFLEQDLNDVFE